MKKYKRVIIAVVIALLAGAWTWRYVTLNAYYDSFENTDTKTYQAGELVPFEDDGLDLYTNLDGYYVRVNRFEIKDYDAYLNEAGFDIKRQQDEPDKIALAYVTLMNKSCEPNRVSVGEFQLHGVDSTTTLDRDILLAANPILKGSTGIGVATGHECELVLPYQLEKKQFGIFTWWNLDDYKFYLKVTNALTRKNILVNP